MIDHFSDWVHGDIPNTSEEGIALYSVSAVSPVSSIIIFASSALQVLRRRIGACIVPDSGEIFPDTRA
jgi:hypothetical protein